jgi:L-alanine-DL-glutamate epimerase-like enolase superfamily enzyme
MHLAVEDIDWTTVRMPFREVPERNMMRQNSHSNIYDVFEVELADGSTGVGAGSGYEWPLGEDPPIEDVWGANAADHMWDDSIPLGLQRALFDAVGRSMGVPVHALLGEKVHNETPLAWWCIDMSPEDWLSECETAIERGYTAVKLKGRPWWDIWEQIDLLCEELPEWFSISIDFNATLLDADRAIPILQELDEYPQVKGFEGPIPYDDVEGDRRIRDAVDANVALHYGSPPVTRQICEKPCDEFVFYGAPPEQTMRQLHVASEADIPGFLQYPGTGLSAAFALHYGAVGETVTLPAISCYELYEHSLLESGFIDVEDGHAEVPDEPGLGFELDRDAVEEFAIERPTERPNPPVLTEWYFPEDGKRAYLTSNSQTGHAKDAEVPFYQRGARARQVPDDGSDAWQDLYETATENEPYVVEEDPLA